MPSSSLSPPLTEPDLAELRTRLLARRHELERVLAPARASVDAERDPGDEGDEGLHQAEVNATIADQERAHALLNEVDAALLRMDRGTYGIGERSGRPIALARLRVIPWARDDVEAED